MFINKLVKLNKCVELHPLVVWPQVWISIKLSHICSSHNVGLPSPVLCSLSHLPPQLGHIKEFPLNCLLPWPPKATHPARQHTFTTWRLFFKKRIPSKNVKVCISGRDPLSVLPPSCCNSMDSIVHITGMETGRRLRIMWNTCIWRQASHIWQQATGLSSHFWLNEEDRMVQCVYTCLMLLLLP